jgi:hypothetical protein
MKKVNETCVLCGETVNIPINMPVDFRPDYIEGAGQLCSDCRRKVYSKPHF